MIGGPLSAVRMTENTMLQDPFATVCLHHAPLRWLAARVRTTNPDFVGTLLFDDLSQMLGDHLQSVDTHIMPVLRPHDAEPAVRQYVNAHWYLKRNLADLKSMDRRGDTFSKRLWAVVRQLEHQMVQEGAELPHLLQERAQSERRTGPVAGPMHTYAQARV
jgi:hypothetical protein